MFKSIDKFFVVLIITLIFLSGLVIYAFRGVFSAYLTAYEISQENLDSNLKLNNERFDEAYNWVLKKGS
ncbi:hypothetical protein A2771_03425 [Candidatus Woesebacteria bacterium RIFCSPHIGHO2_01_FULL_38_26b]|uniref:Uncharacterized protein n=1 Tax=Candidatus Woesebacteria bacterium RIFCSPHIGHO2_01_FULL_38_26b TaxID=1802491 RepID=A0A1F7XYT5_9BACT|nr:MAG: hypothetical protein A2771_03425 [Candidatus Woesebacteria bacterium RIFCSPHIGHO2_01_FULL_38_26b]